MLLMTMIGVLGFNFGNTAVGVAGIAIPWAYLVIGFMFLGLRWVFFRWEPIKRPFWQKKAALFFHQFLRENLVAIVVLGLALASLMLFGLFSRIVRG